MIGFMVKNESRAVKEHSCSLCGNVIKIGEVYVRASGIPDTFDPKRSKKKFVNLKYHLHCDYLMDKCTHETGRQFHSRDDVEYEIEEDFCKKSCPKGVYDLGCDKFSCEFVKEWTKELEDLW